ncbi:protein-L-isoaspartate(D-aspartate) O-methyltransferase [Streptomyces montanisoli]|uniref:Protein-L-isoaspartate O-methyltransferase n=1 Tax=Streptomyces montanisoli TaxID=2798581 RepID=A0A940RWH2_9ACTN|nr:protein-L-isoaspartate(D-aspartate) O-methyltransferase [Streptomyces montanisoli]MBP0460162.1 protein-L-isoaspartate(D-aspartate) O-methyltransferase [Streptomyces montanisoli]
MSYPDDGGTSALRSSLAQRLAQEGHLRSPQWHSAVEETPRHIYVPLFYRQVEGKWESVNADDPDYFDTVYSNTALTTQVISGRATSSSSQPSLMIDMLEELGIEDGQKVGEVATGTGYNGGLICHRVGDQHFVTMELDPELSRLAKTRFQECGYSPVVVAGDARAGFPCHPELDRLIVTCGFDAFPYALARAVRRGGVVVCPLGWGNARLTAGKDGVLEGRFLAGGSYFMQARAVGSTGGVPYPHDPGRFTERTAQIDHSLVRDEMFRFAQSLVLGECNEATELDGEGNATGYRIWSRDGSWASVDGTKVRQAGPRRLWDAVEEIHAWFETHGRPARDRFGVTVTADAQHYWLDEPGSPVPLSLVPPE